MKRIKLVALLLAFTILAGCGLSGGSTPTDLLSAVATDTTVATSTQLEESSVAQTSSKETASAVSSAASSKDAPSKTESSKAASKPAASKPAASKPASSKPSSVVSKPVTVTLTPSKNMTDIVNYTKRPTYASVQKEIKALAKEYPDLIETQSLGTSVQGRELTLLKVGKGRCKALVVGGIHAREHVTVSYVMRCIEEFCAAYTSKTGEFAGYDMINLLDVYTLYFVPLMNPDGLEIVSGRDTPEVTITYRVDKTTGKKMTMADYKANANGVNLNKNFPLFWDKVDTKRPTPDPENYKGTAAASEPETQAMMALCEANDFQWMASMHVRGDCVYWSDTLNPSVGQSQQMVDKLKERCDFYKCPTSKDINGYGGGFENWFRQTYQRPGFCIELMPLDIKVSSQSGENQKYFDDTVRWKVTRKVLPIMMVFGFIEGS